MAKRVEQRICPNCHNICLSDVMNFCGTEVYRCQLCGFVRRDDNSALSYYIYDSNYINFNKEYEEMYSEYDRPIIDKEVDGKRYLLYEAWGIPKSAITHETEFINKTKDMYLNVNGKAEDEYLDFENDINIHLPINTDVYGSFEVSVDDGMVRIVLHEIKNEKPVLKDLSIG